MVYLLRSIVENPEAKKDETASDEKSSSAKAMTFVTELCENYKEWGNFESVQTVAV